MTLDYSIWVPDLSSGVAKDDCNSLMNRFDYADSFIDPNRIKMQMYKEGKRNIWSVVAFRDKVRERKDYLQSHQLDFNEELQDRMIKIWEFFGEWEYAGDVDYETRLFELAGKREELIEERDSINTSLDEMLPTYDRLNEEIKRTDDLIVDARKRCNLQEDLKYLEETKQIYKRILDKLCQIYEFVNDYLDESKYAPLIKLFDDHLLFADIIGFTFDLFRDFFDPLLTEKQLLLALSPSGFLPPRTCRVSKTAVSVLIHTIATSYHVFRSPDVLKEDPDMVEKWESMVLPRFGINEAYYDTHKYEFKYTSKEGEEDGGSLGKEIKKRMHLYTDYLNSLYSFNRQVKSLREKSQ